MPLTGTKETGRGMRSFQSYVYTFCTLSWKYPWNWNQSCISAQLLCVETTWDNRSEERQIVQNREEWRKLPGDSCRENKIVD